jgi:AraC family transcriptional activator of pyochelin receptor
MMHRERQVIAIRYIQGSVPMQNIPNSAARPACDADVEPPLGLFRQEARSAGMGGTMQALFGNLHCVSRGELIADYPERHLQGARVAIERHQGHGSWELYRLDQGLYVVAASGVYDTPRLETVPGEGLIEFHLRLTGVLELTLPGRATPVVVQGPQLLIQYQPPGVDVLERVTPHLRDTCVSLYCRPQLLSELASRNGIERWALLEEIERHDTGSVWHRQLPLSPNLLHVGKSLLECPYRRGIRLLYAEARALELLCEVLSAQQHDVSNASVTSECAGRQLDNVRHLLATNLSTPPRIGTLARAVGMSESKLKRNFKARFGVTVFEFGFECRMRHALELLRCNRSSVGEVTFAVGYQHQSSFASAFHGFFGFLPSQARNGMR